MTGPRRRCRLVLFAALALAAAGSVLVGTVAQAQVAPRDARPGTARTEPARPLAPRVVTPAFPMGPAAGYCQCISDRKRRNTHCLGGAAACQSVCGTTNYSLIPDAAFSCPLAPGEQFAREPLTRERLTQ